MPFIGDLDPTTPEPTDPIGNGDEEIRNLKQTLQDTFPEAGSEAVLFSDLKGGSRNLIINGDMSVWQRGTSFLNVTNRYTVDRWATSSAPADVVQSTDTPNTKIKSPYSVSITGLGNVARILGNVELPATGVEGVFTIGSPFTLSFWAKCTAATPIEVEVAFNTGGGVGSSKVDILSRTQIGTGTGSWQFVTVTFNCNASPNPANNVVRVLIEGNLTNETLLLTQVQLEEGSVATPFKTQGASLAEELALCQRYYEKSYNQDVDIGALTGVNAARFNTGNNVTGAAIKLTHQQVFQVAKRATPTVSVYSTQNGAIGEVNILDETGSSGGNRTPSTVGSVGENGFRVDVAATVTLSGFQYHYTADSEL